MARVKESIVKLSGRFGDAVFYRSENGVRMRSRSSLTKEMIQTEDRFEGTRLANAQFSKNVAYVNLFNNSFEPTISQVPHRKLRQRLMKVVAEMVRADVDNDLGERGILDTELTALSGFGINTKAALGTIVRGTMVGNVDRENGQSQLLLPDLVPATMVSSPTIASRFVVQLQTIVLDFVNGTTESTLVKSDPMSVVETANSPITLTASFEPGETRPILLLASVVFLRRSRGNLVACTSTDGGSASIIYVNTGFEADSEVI